MDIHLYFVKKKILMTKNYHADNDECCWIVNKIEGWYTSIHNNTITCLHVFVAKSPTEAQITMSVNKSLPQIEIETKSHIEISMKEENGKIIEIPG